MRLRRKVMVLLYRHAPHLQVLLLKRAKTDKGEWHPITGNVEPHEQLRAAAIRETNEETGLDVEPEPLGHTYTYEHHGKRYHETTYAARVAPHDDVTLSDEHTAHEWLPPTDARAKLAWPEQQRAIERLVERYG